MERRIHEREIESGFRRRLVRIPPDGSAAIAEPQAFDVVSGTLDRARVCVREQDRRFRPKRRGGDAENAGATAEIDDSFRRLVAHESR